MAKQIEVSDWAYQKLSDMMNEDDTAGSVISRLLASTTTVSYTHLPMPTICSV